MTLAHPAPPPTHHTSCWCKGEVAAKESTLDLKRRVLPLGFVWQGDAESEDESIDDDSVGNTGAASTDLSQDGLYADTPLSAQASYRMTLASTHSQVRTFYLCNTARCLLSICASAHMQWACACGVALLCECAAVLRSSGCVLQTC